MSESWFDQIDRTPVSYAVLITYVTMAFLTDPMQPTLDQLVDHGAAVGILVADGEPWRLLSHAFLHGGLLHLALNSYCLLNIGPPIERYMGWWRFSLLYVVGALCGALSAMTVNHEHVPLVGGSGALFGILGAAVAYNIRGGRTLLDFLENHTARWLISMILLNLAVGLFIPVVSNSAHVGGLCGGFVLVFCFLDTGRRTRVDAVGRVIQAGWVALLLALLWYQMQPVLRFDFNYKQYLAATDPQRKQVLRRYLIGYERLAPDEEWIEEHPPKTDIPGVRLRQWIYEQPSFSRKIRDTFNGWKH
ncbi:MAG: rhomboid family intramembrane serine protease [Planctomycetes bacterium]|nr:rhomboid family intramembrane serine protease [Planctomycetota bacterium]MCB9869707.1 rhomboid family intramembrane serine protease [Planctomycetota bacterium]